MLVTLMSISHNTLWLTNVKKAIGTEMADNEGVFVVYSQDQRLACGKEDEQPRE